MNRRELLLTLSAIPGFWEFKMPENQSHKERAGNFAVDGNRIRFFLKDVKERFTIIMLADTHLFRDDVRGLAYKGYSGRMAGAYHQTSHFLTKEPTNPEESFEKTLDIAKYENAKLVALVGDIFSFPSEAAIEWAFEKLKQSNLPFLYVAGNHDWHYEGMTGSGTQLRETWTHERLLPLYQHQNPLMSAVEINGVRFMALDNSTYEITPEQLEFFRNQTGKGKPVVLMMHIPLYAPGRSIGFGCANPVWGAQSDTNYELERRERWPESGHTETTMTFYSEVLAANNLLGVLAGHIHQQSLDVMNGMPQIVAPANAQGGYLAIEFIPLE